MTLLCWHYLNYYYQNLDMADEKWKIHLDAMYDIYMMAVHNLKIAWDKCPPPLRDPDKTEFKVEEMMLLKKHTPIDDFNTKHKPSFKICNRISDKAFDVQDSTGMNRWISLQYLQLLHPTEHVLTHLPDMTSFGWLMMINYLNIMPQPT